MQDDITSLFGLDVYTNECKHLGKVENAVLDMDGKKIAQLALTDVDEELKDPSKKGILIPYRWVMGVGDIVLVKRVVGFPPSIEEE
ncbi:MAG: PRC-barrel domain protein [Candidatus Methanolliviera sp. GoM_asphalt]|nr:MAG: PRC-barrel domain protein [Candidatus Methanolliviera sp. GoM_asphalt]